MSEHLFQQTTNGAIQAVQHVPFRDEKELQDLVASEPRLLSVPVSQNDAEVWLLIATEAGVPATANSANRWAMDHLFVDARSVPTFVEAKLEPDTGERRRVVGQLVDYAANAVRHWPAERMQELCAVRALDQGKEPDELLAAAFGQSVDAEDFWAQADANLRAGQVRMLFLAQELPDDLESMIRFLNEQMSHAEVLGVELQRFPGNPWTFKPRVVGRTQAAAQVKRRTQWSIERFMEDLGEVADPDVLDFAREIYEWCEGHGDIRWGRGGEGSFGWYVRRDGAVYRPVRFWSRGAVQIGFDHLSEMPAFAEEGQRRVFRDRLRDAGVEIPDEKLDRVPSIRLEQVSAPDGRKAFLEALEWCLKEIERFH